MKLPSRILLAAATLVAASSAHAASYQWDTNGTTAGLGGTGAWNTTTANWDLVGAGADAGVDATTSYTFTNADTAIFGGTAGTATLGTGVALNQLWFKSTGYTVASNTLTLAGASPTVTTDSGVTATISSSVTGSAGLTKIGTGTLVLSGNNNYTGGLNVAQGTLTYTGGGSVSGNGAVQIASGATLNLSGAINNQLEAYGTWTIAGTLANTTNSANTIRATSVILNGGTITSSGGNGGQAGVYGAFYVGAAGVTITANGASNTLSGNGGIGLGGGSGLTLNTALGTDALTVSTILGAGTSGTAGGLTKTGLGTVTLTAANGYTGATTLNGGTLNLGGGTSTGSISSGSALALGGGTLNYSRTGTNTQTFNGTTINAGASAITTTATNTVALGAITARNVGGTVDFSATGTITTMTATNANGILGGYATVGGNTWAVAPSVIGNAITGLAAGSYTASVAGTTAPGATANVDFQASNTTAYNAQTINSLRFNTAAANTLTLTGTNIIATGGILVTGAVGNNLSTITGGTLVGAAGKDLVVIQNNTSNGLTIDSVIADNGGATALTKAGAGTLILSNTNTYTGKTYLGGGITQISADANLGTAPGVAAADQLTFAGGTLRFGAAANLANNRGITITGAGGTIDTNGFNSTYAGIITGTGSLTKAGGGTLTLSGVNTFSGGVNLAGGSMQISAANNLPSGNTISFTNNATLEATSTAGMTLANKVNIAAGQSGKIKSNGNGTVVALTGDYSGMVGTLILDATACTNYGGFSIQSTTGPAVGSVVQLLGTTGAASTQLQLNQAAYQAFFANSKFTITATGTGATFIAAGNGDNNLNLQFGALDGGNATTGLGFDNRTGNTVTVTGAMDGNFAGSITNGGGSAGAVKFVKAGSSTQTLSGTNSYTGGTTISGGTLQISSAANLPTSGGLTLSGGGTLSMTAGMSLASDVTIASGQSGTIKMVGATSGALTGNYSGVVGTLSLDVSGGSGYTGIIINSANGVAAGSTVRLLGATGAGHVQLGLNNSAYQDFLANAKLTVIASGSGATYIALGNGTGVNAKFGAIDGGNATTQIASDNRTSIVTITGTTDGNFAGAINNGTGGSISLIKNGAGAQTLSGANGYSGGTTINLGTLNAANNTAAQYALGTGHVTVQGGTLAINGSTVGQVTLGTGATLAMSSGKIAIDITNGSTFDKVVGNGTAHFTLTGGTLELSGLAGFEGTGVTGNIYNLFSGFSGTGNNTTGLTISGYDTNNWLASLNAATGTLSFSAVPEPSEYGLIGAGALAAVAFVRRRRKLAGKAA